MKDNRIEAVKTAFCQDNGLCDCGGNFKDCSIDLHMIEKILKAADDADSAAGIARVPMVANPAQLMVGLRCAIGGESPGRTYEQMVKAGKK